VCGQQGTDVTCWGSNALRQLGSDDVNVHFRTTTFALADLSNLTTGATRTCVRKVVALMPSWECWGDGASRALDGDILADTVLALADGFRCMKAPNGVRCEGANNHGQLGVGDANNYTGFQDTDTFTSQVNDISEGVSSHRCAAVGNTVGCWGENSFHEVSPDLNGDVLAPAIHDFGATVQRVVVGEDHSCVQLAGGTVTCWGNNDWGQRGPSPAAGYVNVPGDFGSNITAGARHNCGLLADGALVCWGSNLRGAIGIGRNDRSTAAPLFVPAD
jgi:alpha-tubulin suppressor-like RCC1 family protein